MCGRPRQTSSITPRPMEAIPSSLLGHARALLRGQGVSGTTPGAAEFITGHIRSVTPSLTFLFAGFRFSEAVSLA